ncbi:peroxide stress protein YaaA [uncultured Clostridium sp.]|uniref:peroxide stress protein YaaA n=1 Tax=uncultured Clostridium sp. TaxID=59620 RepID=UPI00272B649E|nr:peroxide stress protein YaaA [uncultured Clostridium sp.]
MNNKNFNIIISPAKKMNINNDDIISESIPCFIEKTENLLNNLKNYKYDDLKKLLACNDEIAELNYSRYKNMNLYKNLSPAILSYEGIQYKYMSPDSFSNSEFDYISNHLKILSGFYGILNPLDGIVPYRLEMQAKLAIESNKNLYSFWGDSIYKELIKDTTTILNLASKEYSKTIEKYLTEDIKFITCIFGSLVDSKIKVKATEAKMARGIMIRYLAENNITDIEKVKDFKELEFSYSNEYSTPTEFVFLK